MKIKRISLFVMSAVCSVLMLHTTFTTGYEVVAEGKTIGFVEDAGEVIKICEKFEEEVLAEYGHDALIDDKIELIEKTDLKNNITTAIELEKNISELSEFLEEAYVLVIDGKDSIAFYDVETINSVLEKIKSDYKIDDGETEIIEKTEYRKEYLCKSKIYDFKSGYNYIKNNSVLNVKIVVNAVYTGTVGYKTVSVGDNSMYEGSIEVTSEGEVGESLIQAKVTYINGKEERRVIVNEEIIKRPISQYQKEGTLKLPEGYGTKEFINPLKDCILTSNYGQRWGRLHGGIDLAAEMGTDICTSDNGKVIFTGNMGSYGQLVKIDHSNGYVTYYAHCSEILVSEGDIVKKGDIIAKVGNTGNSTGPHCHFEIRYNNEPVDPFEFIDFGESN